MLEGRGSGSQWRCAGEFERYHERREERADVAEKGGQAGIEPSREHSKPPEGAGASVRWRHEQGKPST